MEIHEMEGYDEVIQKVVSRLTPEQRVAGLTPEERLLLLPDAMLRMLPDELLSTLPEPTRAAIRARIGR